LQILNRSYMRMASAALVGAMMLAGTAQLAQAQAPAAPEKKVKDQGEYDIYNQTLKDIANPAALLKDLDTWAQKYPESDYKDDRVYYYITAYAGTKNPAKVLEVGNQLMARDLKKVYSDPKAGPQQILTVLYQMCAAILSIPSPTADQSAIGEKAARGLAEFVPNFFTAANKPAAATDANWNEAKGQMDKIAKDAILKVLTQAGAEALARYQAQPANAKDPKECAAAEAVYRKAIEQIPDSAMVAYQLGRALRCQQAAGPEKVPQALYEFARASMLDPSLGGTMDPKALNTYVETAYKNFHGDLEGLDQIKALAKNSPLPPADLKIQSAREIMEAKQAQFEATNPQLALWMKIKGALSDKDGVQYFEGQLKDSGVPPLKGTLIEGKPACRSKELLVAVPLPDQTGSPTAEITLKLDTPLTGKPEAGTTIQWEGVPKAFTPDPFMLTMDVEKAKVENVKTSPCTAAPVKKAAPKKK
jgi:hypothetical protein